MKILFTGSVPSWVKEKLESSGHSITSVSEDAYIDQQLFCEGIKGFDVYVSGGLEKCSNIVIENANKLKAIIFLGVDYKAYIDEDAAKRKNIPIYNTPGANARAVAELTIMLILMAARNAVQMISDASNKIWKAQSGFELKGKTLGIIGSGPIALNVSEMAQGLGMQVNYWSRSGAKKSIHGLYKNLDDLLHESDILSLHIPEDAGVFLDKSAFAKIKPNAILINTSSASLVDPDALYNSIAENKIRTVAFDTFYTEGEKAWHCPKATLLDFGPLRFFITPHAGWKTKEADDNMFGTAINHIAKIVFS